MSARLADFAEISAARMTWERAGSLTEELSDHAYRITWQMMSTGPYYRAYTPGGRLIDAGGGERGKTRCRQACELHLASGRRAL